MKRTSIVRRLVFAILGGVLSNGGSIILPACVVQAATQDKTEHIQELEEEKLFKQALKSQEAIQAAMRLKLLVQPGTSGEASDYYGRISGKEFLNFTFKDSTLDSLLAYMGFTVSDGKSPPSYSGLLAKDFEQLPSFVLMPRDQAEFDVLKSRVSDPVAFDSHLDFSDFQNDKVLVSRFFAPKIATYYDTQDPFRPVNPDTIIPGWRKVVRITARPNSDAVKAGILHLYLLFNVKQPDPDADPFAIKSDNNQVILVPSNQDAKDSAYFAVYGSQAKGYIRSDFLKADFDLPGHVGVDVPGAEDGKYFVPRSCAECHGHSGGRLKGQPLDANGQPTEDFKTGIYRFAKPNYLDTDQWYDWMEFDFRGVATSLNDVAFDGGKSHGSADYARAMGVFQKLNTSIKDQTFAAEQVRGTKSYQTQAAEKWLSLHQTDLQRIPYSNRSIGNEEWNSENRDEMRLLRLLDNHCFRCHSSLRYNVFDRQRVGQLKVRIQQYITTKVPDANGNPLAGYFMPQGRVLPIEERDEILRLLNLVFP